MNVDNELKDFDAAGALAEELPWWGWLEDGRSCLTRAGELMAIASLTPSVLDGQTPEQLDRVVGPLAAHVERRRFADPPLLLFAPASHPIRETKARTKDRAWPRLDDASAERSLRNGYRALALMSHGRMIPAYPPSPLKRQAGRGGWPMQKTGWRGGAINMNRFTLNPLSRRRRGASGKLVEASRALVDDLTAVQVLDAGGRVARLKTN